jgi:hypothetical protein
VRAIAQRAHPKGYFRLLEAPARVDLARQTQAVTRNLINLFEVPVVFYALVPPLIVCGVRSDLRLGLFGAFVALRYLHTAIHVTINVVPWRFAAYVGTSLALLGAWLHFASLLSWPG